MLICVAIHIHKYDNYSVVHDKLICLVISSNTLQDGFLLRVAVFYHYDTKADKQVDTLFKEISIGSSMVSRSKASAQFMSEDIIGERGTR